MKLTIERVVSDSDATLGILWLESAFKAFTLEDEFRIEKVKGETRIPAGTYQTRVRTWGGFHERYSASRHHKFYHEGMIELLDVPGFTDILIHCGNTDEHTAGCLLVGMGANTYGEMNISASRVAYRRLYVEVIETAKTGNLAIEIIDRDRQVLAA